MLIRSNPTAEKAFFDKLKKNALEKQELNGIFKVADFANSHNSAIVEKEER